MTLGLILPLSGCIVILLRPFLLSLSLNTLIAPCLHTLSLLLEHHLMLFKVFLFVATALLPSAVAVHRAELSLQAAVLLIWHL